MSSAEMGSWSTLWKLAGKILQSQKRNLNGGVTCNDVRHTVMFDNQLLIIDWYHTAILFAIKQLDLPPVWYV